MNKVKLLVPDNFCGLVGYGKVIDDSLYIWFVVDHQEEKLKLYLKNIMDTPIGVFQAPVSQSIFDIGEPVDFELKHEIIPLHNNESAGINHYVVILNGVPISDTYSIG